MELMEELHTTAIKPTDHTERITALDILRGFVLCGILLMNITGFGLAGAYSNPNVSGGATGLNLYAWMTTNLFFEGTMRAMFSMLFGVGTYILLERLDHRKAGMEAAEIFMRRMVWLLFFGLVHGYLLLWTGEILYDYATSALRIVLCGIDYLDFSTHHKSHLASVLLFWPVGMDMA